jgi:hypothetical protein
LSLFLFCIETGDSSETQRRGIDVSGARWGEVSIEWDGEHIKVGESSLEMAIDFGQQLQFYSVGGLMAMWETENCCQVFSLLTYLMMKLILVEKRSTSPRVWNSRKYGPCPKRSSQDSKLSLVSELSVRRPFGFFLDLTFLGAITRFNIFVL